jgi:hypothetical protein
MKKIIFLFLIVHCSLIVDNCLCQWQADVRLTNDTAFSGLSNNNAMSMATNGNTVHIAWYDNRDGNIEIYYKRSTDKGVTWGTDTRLTNNSAVSEWPALSVSGSLVYIVWYDNRDGNYELYFKRSTDGGTTWTADSRLTNFSGDSYNPSISAADQIVHVSWYDNRNGNNEIYHKRSTDGGISWGADTRLTNNTATSWDPAVSVSGSIIHIIWWDNRDGNYEIYYKRSTDAGITWGADTRLTIDNSSSEFPSLSVSGSEVCVTWSDNRDGNFEIYYKRSTDAGITWGNDIRLTNNPAISRRSFAESSGQYMHIVWGDNRDGNYEIYYKRSTDAGITWGTDTRLTNNPAVSERPFLSVSGQVVNVVWNDNRDGNYELYYKRDSTGNPIGIQTISAETPDKFRLSQNYPNPFNPVTNIEFAVPKSSFVKMTVFDVLGKEIDILVNENLKAGTYKADWNASKYPSGVYFYKLQAENFSETKKMILIK